MLAMSMMVPFLALTMAPDRWWQSLIWAARRRQIAATMHVCSRACSRSCELSWSLEVEVHHLVHLRAAPGDVGTP